MPQCLADLAGYRMEFSLKLWMQSLYRTAALVVLRHLAATPYKIAGTCGPALGIPELVTRVRTHNQNITVAASAIAERKTVGDLS